ncbi:hypothetical protein [Microbacterium sp.]|uniref:DUF7224 domain-containing protein n=1 Tax=Microbacterium sp. TaxID=51671 RepID=UPI003A8B6777
MRSPLPLRRRAVLWLLLPALPLLAIVAQFSSPAITFPGSWTWTIGHSVLLVLVSLTAWGGGSAFPWGMVGAIAAMLFFHTSLGFALGSVVHPVFGIPLALASSYIWLGFTGTVSTFELRHLAGLVLETCCSYDRQPDARSVLAATMFSLLAGLGLLFLAAAALRIVAARTWLATLVGGALVVAGVWSGFAAARGLGPSAAEPRDSADLVCAGGRVRVCLFPEQVDSAVFQSIQTMVHNVRHEGVSVADSVVASSAVVYDEDTIRLGYMPGMTEEQIAQSLASDLPEPVCSGDRVDVAIARDTFRSTAVAWIAITMLGGDRERLDSGDLDTEVGSSLDALLVLPRAAQAAWVNEAISAVRDCAVSPPEGPR